MEFSNIYHFSIPFFGGNEIWVTDATVALWIIGALLITLAIIARIHLKKFTEKPKGFQNVLELMVDSMDNFVSNTISPKYSSLGWWFFGVFAIILGSNLSGLFLLRPPTADLSVTVGIALVSFLLIHFLGIKEQKGKYFKEYLHPMPLFLPINLMGELATPISLSFRLFGNLLSGVIILGLVYGMLPWFLKLGIPAALNIYFDIFAGTLQAYIFCVLSMTFIKNKLGVE